MSSTKPTHRAFIVRNYQADNGAEKAHWTQIGSVFAHKDGKGFDVILSALPVDGRISIRVDEPKPSGAKGGAQ